MNTLTNLGRTIRLAAWLIAGAMCWLPLLREGKGNPLRHRLRLRRSCNRASSSRRNPAGAGRFGGDGQKGNYIRDLTQNDFKVFER